MKERYDQHEAGGSRCRRRRRPGCPAGRAPGSTRGRGPSCVSPPVGRCRPLGAGYGLVARCRSNRLVRAMVPG
eukprot:8965130-Alexandrium_andersonii.AAC.1